MKEIFSFFISTPNLMLSRSYSGIIQYSIEECFEE